MGARKPADLRVAPGELVLHAPGHWHVDLVVYSHEDNGQLMAAVHLHNLVTNDLALCETAALEHAAVLAGPKREHVRTEQATVCDDPKHRDTAQAKLLKGR